MTALKRNQDAFFALVRAGLWGKGSLDIRIDGTADWNYIYQLTKEQSVQGLVLQGIEEFRAHGINLNIPKIIVLQWIGEVQMIERRNKDMNAFIFELIEKLRKADIYTLLVKGQGIAQCYEKPLWRSCGDVDLFLSYDNYQKAKSCLLPIADHVDPEDTNKLHLAMTINSWVVELHGTMHTVISNKINRVLDYVQEAIFTHGEVRVWDNNGADLYLPNPDNDIIIIFTHFINHFYGEGVGIRQICDWCRLLWKYHSVIDNMRLKIRIEEMNLMTEWTSFAYFAVTYLGMPEKAMPLYVKSSSIKRKADHICRIIIGTGNLGQNKDNSYRNTSSKFKSNIITFWRRFREFSLIATIFPENAPKFFVTYVYGRVKALL